MGVGESWWGYEEKKVGDWVGAGRAGWVGGVGRVEVGRVGCWRAGWEGCGTNVHTARKGVCMAE